MTYTLWELLRDSYQALGQLNTETATGGTTNTLVDAKLAIDSRDGDWVGSTVILIDAGGDAPEGEFSRVNDFVAGTGTLTIDELSAAIVEGNTYGLVNEFYPLRQMIELVNAALRELGDIPLVDTTTLDTAEHQTEYACAVAWKRRPPFRIDIQTKAGNLKDHGWQQIYWWEYVPAGAGSSGLLVFDRQLPPGRGLRVWYQDRHPRVSVYSDVIYEGIAPDVAVFATVKTALKWQITRLEGENPFLLQRMNDAQNEFERALERHPIWQPPRPARSRLAGMGDRR